MISSKRNPDKPHRSDSTVQAAILHPAFEQIQKRAFEIYQARGCVSGREQDDWLLAKKELKAELELQFQVEQKLKEDLEK